MGIVGHAALYAAAIGYVRFWGILLFSRSRPKVDDLTTFGVPIAGTLGLSIGYWPVLSWWWIPLFWLGLALAMLIPAALFKAL